MPNEINRIEQSSNYNLVPTPNQDNKHAKKAGDGTMNFMFWSIAGTALAACSSPIFSDVADLAGGGGGGDTQSGAGAGAITNGRWAGAQVYMIDEDGFRVDESGTRNANADAVGYSDGAGDIIFNAGMSPMRDQLYVADLNGATEIVTDRQGMSGEELRSLPYEGGALIISPLTDLLARAYDDAPDSAKEDGEDAFYQDTLNDIYGVRPQFDAAGAPMVDGEGAFVNPTPLITLADVLNADNYNPFVDGDTASDTVTEAVSLASNAASALARGASSSTPTQRVAALVEGFEEFRTSVQSQRDETMLEPDLDSGQVLGVDLKSDVEASVTAAQPRPVVAIPEGRAPIRMTEDVDFTLVSGNAESLFGFKDPFGNADSPDDADTEREPGQLVGIYIEATSTGVDVMFRLENGTIVDLDDQRAVTERGAPSDGTSPAMTTVGNVRFFYVSEANFDQLILRPDDNFNTAAASVDNRQIRFYVYDGEHATVDNNDPIDSLDSVGSLEIEVVAANDAPSEVTLDNLVASYAGADNARPTDDVLIGTLSSVDVDSTTFTYDITAGRDNFVIGGADNDQLFLQIGAEARAVGMMWSVSITSTDDTGLTSAVQTFMITRGGLEVTPPGDNMDPVFSGGELLPEQYNPEDESGLVSGTVMRVASRTWNVLVDGEETPTASRAGLLLGTLSDGGQSDSFVVVYGSNDDHLFAVGGDDNNQIYYIGGAIGDADAPHHNVNNILSHTVIIRGLAQNGDTVENYEYVTNVENDPADNPPEIQGDDVGATLTGSGDSASGRFTANDDTAGDTIAWTAPRVSGSTDYGSITFGDDDDYETTWTFELSQAGRAALDALDANDAALTTAFTITATDRMGNEDTKTLTITLQGVNDAPSAVTLDNSVASYAGTNPTANVLIGTLSSVDVDSTTFTYSITAGSENFVLGGADNDQLFLLRTAAERAVGGMWDVSITSTDDTGQALAVAQTFTITRGGVGVTPPGDNMDTVYSRGEGLLPEEYNPETNTGLVSGDPAALTRVDSGTWNVLVAGRDTSVTGRDGLLLGTLSDDQSDSFEVLYPAGSSAANYLFAVLNDNQLYYIGGAIGDADAAASGTNILSHTIMVRGLATNGNTDHTYVVNVANDPDDDLPVINTSTSNFARTITDVPATETFMATGDLVATDATNDPITWTRTLTGENYGDVTFADATLATTTWTFELNQAGLAALRALGDDDTPLTTTFDIIATDDDGGTDTEPLTITLQGEDSAPSEVTLNNLVAGYAGAGNVSPGDDVLIGTLGSVDVDSSAGFIYRITAGAGDFRIQGDQLYLLETADGRAPGGEWNVAITSRDDTNEVSAAQLFTITRGDLRVTPTGEDAVFSGAEGLLARNFDVAGATENDGMDGNPIITDERLWDARVITTPAATQEVAFTPNAALIGEHGQLLVTTTAMGTFGDLTDPDVAQVELRLNTNGLAGSELSISVQSFADHLIVVNIAQDDTVTTWDDIVELINTHDVAGTIVEATLTDRGFGDDVITIDDDASRPATHDELDFGPLHITAREAGDLADTITIGFATARGALDVEVSDETIVITIPNSGATWQQIFETLYNDLDVMRLIDIEITGDLTEQVSNAQLTDVRTTLDGGADQTPSINAGLPLTGGEGISLILTKPDTGHMGANRLGLTAVEGGDGDHSIDDAIPTIMVTLALGGAGGTGAVIADPDTTTTPGTTIIAITAEAGTTWGQIAEAINEDSTDRFDDIVTAQILFGSTVAAVAGSATLEGGLGTPDDATLEDNEDGPILVFSSRIAGDNAEDDVPKIQVALAIGSTLGVAVTGTGADTTPYIITITAPVGTAWDAIRDAVNDHVDPNGIDAGDLVSVVGADGANLAALIAAPNATGTPIILDGGTNAQDEVIAIPSGADDVIEDSRQVAKGLFIGELSDAGGSVNFEVIYDEADPSQNEDHEQVFVVIADGSGDLNQLYFIGDNTGSHNSDDNPNTPDYLLTVRGYDDSNVFTQEYEYAVNIEPHLAVSSEGVRESIVISGVEFRALVARPMSNNTIRFRDDGRNDITSSSGTIGINTRDFSQAGIAGFWNTDTSSNSNYVATIIEEMSSIDTHAEWTEGGFTGGSTAADREVTKGSDFTASGWLKVTGGTGDVTFGGTMTGELGGTSGAAAHTDTREYTYTSTYGDLVIDGDGDWVYTLGGTTDQNSAVMALTSTIMETFIVEVSRGDEMENLDIEITVNGAADGAADGANEAPTDITTSTIGQLAVAYTDSASVPTGPNGGLMITTLSTTDPDDTDGTGTYTYTRSGTHGEEFEIRNGNELWLLPAPTEDVGAGGNFEITITTRDSGGMTYSQDFTISRGNSPTLSAPTPADNGVTEDDTGDATVTGGTLTFDDADAGQDKSNLQVYVAAGTTATDASTEVAPGATGADTEVPVVGTYGSFMLTRTMAGDVTWTYTLDHTDADTQALRHSQEVTDQLAVIVYDSDGISSGIETITIDVTGANDAPVLGAIPLNAVTIMDNEIPNRDSRVTAGSLTGIFTVTDIDMGDTHTFSAFRVADAEPDETRDGFTHRVNGSYGMLFYDSGSGEYEYVPDEATIDAFPATRQTGEAFAITVTDDSGAANDESNRGLLNVSIDGADEVAVPAPSQAPAQQQPQQGVEIYSDDMDEGLGDDIPPQNPELI